MRQRLRPRTRRRRRSGAIDRDEEHRRAADRGRRAPRERPVVLGEAQSPSATTLPCPRWGTMRPWRRGEARAVETRLDGRATMSNSLGSSDSSSAAEVRAGRRGSAARAARCSARRARMRSVSGRGSKNQPVTRSMRLEASAAAASRRASARLGRRHAFGAAGRPPRRHVTLARACRACCPSSSLAVGGAEARRCSRQVVGRDGCCAQS